MDPRTRLLLLLMAGTLALVLERPGTLLLLTALCALPLLFVAEARAWWGRALLLAAALVWSTLLSQGLFYAAEPRVAWLRLGPLTLWREGLSWGLVQSLRFVSVSLAGLALAVSTPADRLLAALSRLRVPFGLAFLTATSLRFVPVIAGEWRTARQARARRGRPAWRRPPWAWLRLEVQLLRPVLARSLRRARALAESLDARGFDPQAARAVRRPLRFAPWELPLLALGALVTASAVAGRILFLLYTSDTLYLPGLRPVYAVFRGWL